MPVADLRASVSGGKACPNNCGGNGVCNSLGHCHCNRGFRPPDCTQPGVGGSEDSGPAEDPNGELILFHLPHPRTGYCYYHYYYLSLSVESNLSCRICCSEERLHNGPVHYLFGDRAHDRSVLVRDLVREKFWAELEEEHDINVRI